MRLGIVLASLAVLGLQSRHCVAQSPTTASSSSVSIPAVQQQIDALRAIGEAATPADLKTWPALAEQRNSAKVVYGLVERMRHATPDGGSWANGLTKQSRHEYQIPLSEQDAAELREALRHQQDVLKQLDRIFECDGFDWGGPPPSPLAVKHDDFPFGAFWGTCRKQLYFDGLLAVHERDLPRAWRRVEVLRRLGEGMATYPGDHDGWPQWRHLHELAARLAGFAAGAPLPQQPNEERKLLESLMTYWLDDRPILNAFIRQMQVERVTILDASQLIEAGKLQPEQMKLSGYRVSDYVEMKVGVPMWPAAAEMHTRMIEAIKSSQVLSRADTGRKLGDTLKSFSLIGGIAPLHVVTTLGPNYEGFHQSLLELRGLQKLAATAVALRLYRVDHGGALPSDLKELVPRYLENVPIDTTSQDPATATIRYRSADEPMLWIAWLNGRDDGGRPRPADVSPFNRQVASDEIVRLAPPSTQPTRR